MAHHHLLVDGHVDDRVVGATAVTDAPQTDAARHADTVRAFLMLGTPGDAFIPDYKARRADTFRALDALAAAAAAAEQHPLVTCVAKDSHGRPYLTVKLLGDREAVEAVTQAVARADRLEQERDEARALLTKALDVGDAAEAQMSWYDDHKRDDGSYDGEAWGDLRALASPAPDREAG